MASVNPFNVLQILSDLCGDPDHFSSPVTEHERALATYMKAVLDNATNFPNGGFQSKRSAAELDELDPPCADISFEPESGGPVAKRTRLRTEECSLLHPKVAAISSLTKGGNSTKPIAVLQTEDDAASGDGFSDDTTSEEEESDDGSKDEEYRSPEEIAKEKAQRKAAELAAIPKNLRAALIIDPVTFDYKRRCVAYYRSGLARQRKKLLGIENVQVQFTRCRSIAMLQRWDATVLLHDERVSKLGIIQEMVLEEIGKAMESGVDEITDENIRQMALEANEQVQCDIFSASQSWIDKFKSENQEAAPENQTWSTGLPGNCDEENLIDEEDLREVEEDIAENLAAKQAPILKKTGVKKTRSRRQEAVSNRDSDESVASLSNPVALNLIPETSVDVCFEYESTRSNTTEPGPVPRTSRILSDDEARKNFVYANLMRHGEKWDYQLRAVAYWKSGKTKLLSPKDVARRFRRMAPSSLRKWDRYLKEHGENWDKLKKIMLFALERIAEAKSIGIPFITDTFIRDKALEANRDIGLDCFEAKRCWVKGFKVLNKDFVPNVLVWPDRLPGVEASGSGFLPEATADDLERIVMDETEDAVSDLATFDVGEFSDLL